MELKLRKSKLVENYDEKLFNIGDVIKLLRYPEISDEFTLAVISGYHRVEAGRDCNQHVLYQIIRLNMFGDPLQEEFIPMSESHITHYKIELFHPSDEYTRKLINYFYYNEDNDY